MAIYLRNYAKNTDLLRIKFVFSRKKVKRDAQLVILYF